MFAMLPRLAPVRLETVRRLSFFSVSSFRTRSTIYRASMANLPVRLGNAQ